ncbi:hypothetical protein BD324DRAFT_679307 [Kockovaella imperatae]|uniref:Uncharacterized protein n=1 Tax=Kockovaella imperatae TaxID=4999 RepID=A0A1Y1UQP5_9TREE|nr:hypothetical protein BD324DRAFT_679307 [Kockovaella imperatae]ORX40282.1 hypothetical protein BD324DRAFT_679307 [Kockovaella imperatae]
MPLYVPHYRNSYGSSQEFRPQGYYPPEEYPPIRTSYPSRRHRFDESSAQYDRLGMPLASDKFWNGSRIEAWIGPAPGRVEQENNGSTLTAKTSQPALDPVPMTENGWEVPAPIARAPPRTATHTETNATHDPTTTADTESSGPDTVIPKRRFSQAYDNKMERQAPTILSSYTNRLTGQPAGHSESIQLHPPDTEGSVPQPSNVAEENTSAGAAAATSVSSATSQTKSSAIPLGFTTQLKNTPQPIRLPAPERVSGLENSAQASHEMPTPLHLPAEDDTTNEETAPDQTQAFVFASTKSQFITANEEMQSTVIGREKTSDETSRVPIATTSSSATRVPPPTVPEEPSSSAAPVLLFQRECDAHSKDDMPSIAGTPEPFRIPERSVTAPGSVRPPGSTATSAFEPAAGTPNRASTFPQAATVTSKADKSRRGEYAYTSEGNKNLREDLRPQAKGVTSSDDNEAP